MRNRRCLDGRQPLLQCVVLLLVLVLKRHVDLEHSPLEVWQRELICRSNLHTRQTCDRERIGRLAHEDLGVDRLAGVQKALRELTRIILKRYADSSWITSDQSNHQSRREKNPYELRVHRSGDKPESAPSRPDLGERCCLQCTRTCFGPWAAADEVESSSKCGGTRRNQLTCKAQIRQKHGRWLACNSADPKSIRLGHEPVPERIRGNAPHVLTLEKMDKYSIFWLGTLIVMCLIQPKFSIWLVDVSPRALAADEPAHEGTVIFYIPFYSLHLCNCFGGR